jgi:hypothetical protein
VGGDMNPLCSAEIQKLLLRKISDNLFRANPKEFMD